LNYFSYHFVTRPGKTNNFTCVSTNSNCYLTYQYTLPTHHPANYYQFLPQPQPTDLPTILQLACLLCDAPENPLSAYPRLISQGADFHRPRDRNQTTYLLTLPQALPLIPKPTNQTYQQSPTKHTSPTTHHSPLHHTTNSPIVAVCPPDPAATFKSVSLVVNPVPAA
jgi:hypothetical protein